MAGLNSVGGGSVGAVQPGLDGIESSIPGQRHDRIRNGEGSSHAAVPLMDGVGDDEELGAVNISAGQRMISAVTGSLITSLLGMGDLP